MPIVYVFIFEWCSFDFHGRILTKYRNDPRRMQLINKHFYAEKVFDDSNPDTLLARWRHRNFFGANAAQSTQDDYYNDKPDLEPKQFTVSRA